MTVRDLGLVALGFLAGLAFAACGAAFIAYDVASTDAVIRGLRLKYNPGVRGQG